MNLWPIFLIGLTTGGLSCLAVQGGFLASIIANQKEHENPNTKYQLPNTVKNTKVYFGVVSFLIAKLLSHLALGFLLGLLGSTITLSDTARLTFQLIAAFFMFATAMNLLDVHPIFRYIAFQPPKFITKRVRAISTNSSLFAPFLLGLFTVFIPCGVTQAMEVQAIALGNPIQSALLMAAFVIGTMPLFSLIGVAMAKLSEAMTSRFLRLAAYALILMALYSLNGVLEVTNAPLRASRIQAGWISFWTPDTQKKASGMATPIVNGAQDITIDILNNGYSPKYIRVQKNIPVNLTLRSTNAYSCALDFHLKAFGIREFLEATDQKNVSFTPTAAGKYQFTCGMGMYTGVLEVI